MIEAGAPGGTLRGAGQTRHPDRRAAMDSSTSTRPLRRGELLALLSFMMALTALSIDLMLPSFGEIRSAFGIEPTSSETAGIVTVYMIGLSVAQVFYGPFADRFGRKPVVRVGFALYALGALGAALAPTFGWLLTGRLLWGLGAAGPRVLSVTIIRDTHEGDRMARTMSFVMAVFILVPVFAPTVGAAIVSVAPWRALFWFCVAFVTVIALWSLRLPETLRPEDRIALRFDGLRRAGHQVVGNRRTMGYALAMTLMYGAFMSWIATSELMVDDVFGLSSRFPLIFGGLAALMGTALLTNASIVERFGARRLAPLTLSGFTVGSALLLLLVTTARGRPSFWLFFLLLAATQVCYSLTVPNLNSLAMEPMGKVAGTASAIIGALQTGGGALLGALVDHFYDGTVTPFALGYLVAGFGALAAFAWGNSGGGQPPTSR